MSGNHDSCKQPEGCKQIHGGVCGVEKGLCAIKEGVRAIECDRVWEGKKAICKGLGEVKDGLCNITKGYHCIRCCLNCADRKLVKEGIENIHEGIGEICKGQRCLDGCKKKDGVVCSCERKLWDNEDNVVCGCEKTWDDHENDGRYEQESLCWQSPADGFYSEGHDGYEDDERYAGYQDEWYNENQTDQGCPFCQQGWPVQEDGYEQAQCDKRIDCKAKCLHIILKGVRDIEEALCAIKKGTECFCR